MTLSEFMAKVLDEFPDAYVGEDNDGQLVIYTGQHVVKEGDELTVRKMEEA